MAPIHELINAPKKSPKPDVAHMFPDVDRDALTRLIIQSLSDLGYDRSAQLLKEESGLELDSPVINSFIAAVRAGNFDAAEQAVSQLHLTDDTEAARRTIQYLIKRQKFMECLYCHGQNTATALQLLRQEINDLTNKDNIRSLTSLLMNRESQPLQIQNGWLGTVDASRENLLNDISKFINPNEMIPKFRLFKLVEQSIKYQKYSTLYPFGGEGQKVSLYEDAKSDKSQFPDTIIRTLDDHLDEVWYVSFSHNGSLLATASADHTVYIYDVENDFELLTVLKGHDKQVMYVSFSPDDGKLLTCSIESTARLWDVKTGEKMFEISLGGDARVWCGDWFPNGECFVLGSPDKEIGLYDAMTGKQLHKWEGPIINDLKVSADFKMIGVTYEKNVEIWDLKLKNKVQTLNIGERITSVATSKKLPDQILINVCPNELQLWDWKRSALIAKYVGHKQEKFILRSCFGYDEQLVCSGSEDGRVFLWNREFGALLGVFDAHNGITNCVAWNNSKKNMFATSGDDHLVHIWGPKKTMLN